MKFLVLIIGLLIIGIIQRDNLKDNSGVGGLEPLILWMAYFIVWLIVFYVAGVQLPKFIIQS